MENAGEGNFKDHIINNPCKCLEEAIRAMLKCLGFDISSSSWSSDSGDGEKDGGDQSCDLQDPPASTTTTADDPPPSTTDDPPLSTLIRRPTRPGLGNPGDPQTNDTSS